jgi:hypothetical protein
MATYYIDYEGGNDANDGLSFANRWKTMTNGATAARIAPGDEIRIMASPDPTSMGSATWTGGGRPTAISISSSTNATPIVITTATAHGLTTGDYVVVASHTTNTNANGVWRVGTTPSATEFQILQMDGSNTTGNGVGGATGNITKANNLVVKTASPLVKNIALYGGLGQKPAWTASANVTATQNTTDFKEGNSAANIAISAAFTTGKAAYYTLPASLDLSAFQQVSFWVRQSTASIGTAGSVYLALCTDTIGNTVAHTCNIPALGSSTVWVPVTVNLGTNLNAAIQSVALYVVTDNGAQTFQIDNIIACKAASSADSVTLTSLISKSDGTGDESWYPIQSINNDVIMIANQNSLTSLSANVMGYSGTTETVTSYKRETIKVDPQATPTAAGLNVVTDSGTAGNLITYSGGWNRTDMSTQTGVTWLDGQNGNSNGVGLPTVNYISIDRIYACRFNNGLSVTTSTYITIGNQYGVGNSSAGFATNQFCVQFNVGNLWINNNGGSQGITFSGFGHVLSNIKLVANHNTGGVAFSTARNVYVGSVTASNNGNVFTIQNGSVFFSGGCFNVSVGTATITASPISYAILLSSAFNCYINGGSSSGCAAGVLGSTNGILYLNNFTVGEANEVDTPTSISGVGPFIYSNRHDNTDNNSWVFQPGIGTINQQSSVVDSPATTAWQMRPTSTNATALSPVRLKIGTVVCAASTLVTVTVRMRRDDTGLTMRLVCPGGQISGVANDVSADMTAAANTWETVTITFTPSKAGAVDIYAYAFGGTTYSGYVCNLTAAQA